MSPRKLIEEIISNATFEVYNDISGGQFRPSITVNIPSCVTSITSLLTNGLLIYFIIAHKFLKSSSYVYMLNWRVLDSCFLLVSEGVRPLIEMVIDPNELYYFDFYGLTQMFQSSSMLVSVLYSHTYKMHYLDINFKYAVVLVWCLALVETILSIELITNHTYNKILKIYLLALFVLLSASICMQQCGWYFIFGTQEANDFRLVLNLTSIYVLFWLPYWSFMFVTSVSNWIPLEFDVTSLLRCIGFASAPAIFVGLLCLDANFCKHFSKMFRRCFARKDERGGITLESLDEYHNVIIN